MLTLATAQVSQLEERAVQRYLLRLDAFFLEHFPEKLRHVPTQERLRLWAEAMRRAGEKGIRSEQHVCLYAILILAIGFARLTELLALHEREREIDMDLVYQHACASVGAGKV